MKHDARNMISLRRRHLMIAGLAGVAAPATLFAGQCSATLRDALGPFYKSNAPAVTELCASGSGGKDKLVVSGRILGAPDCKPLAGATLEVWHADTNGDYSGFRRGKQDDPDCLLRASVTTDADGRFMFTTIAPAEYPGRPRHLHYRVSHKGHETLVTQLYFARARGVADNLVAQLQRDDAGIWRATFGLTLV